MHPSERLIGSDSMVSELHAEILKNFKGAGIMGFTAKGHKILDNPQSRDFLNFCMLRYQFEEDKGFLALGYASKQSSDTLERLKLINTPASEAQNKLLRQSMVKSIFQVVENEYKKSAKIFTTAHSSIVLGQEAGLWDKLAITKSLQFAFETPHGELQLDVPIFSAQWETQKIQELFGFSDQLKILLVDDSVTGRKMIQNFLKMTGFFRIEEAKDGVEAFAKIKEAKEPYGLLISDWHMPNMLGIDLLKNVRAHVPTKSLPVILATGEQKKDEILKAIKEGVNAYLVKPVGAESLYQAIQKIGKAPLAKKVAA